MPDNPDETVEGAETAPQTENPPAPPVEQQQNQTSTTPSATATEKKAVSEVSHAQPNEEETVRQMLVPFEKLLGDNSRTATDRFVDVLAGLNQQDTSLLNSDIYYEIRKQLAKKLGVSKTLVDNCKVKLLKVATNDDDVLQFPDKPLTASPKGQTPAGGAPASGGGGGAPFGGGNGTDPAETPAGQEGEEPEELIVWDAKKVGIIVSAGIELPNIFFKEWIPVTKEEREELGKSFLDIFKEYFATSKKTGNLLFTLAALEQVIKPRAQAVVEHRLQGKPLEEVKNAAKQAVKEAHPDK